jgi:2,3-bisphosphoglycerate-independent phosphoglycerate mutase
MINHKRALLMILDGWGIGDGTIRDAITTAHTPFMDSLAAGRAASATLKTCGEDVGLPEGQMGNSEVGHLNIGAGRIVYQDLVKINIAARDGSMARNPVILEACRYAREHRKTIHLLGLVSDGGVHSSTRHLMALCDITREQGLKDVMIHVLTDGRDTDPKSGLAFVEELQEYLQPGQAKIASVCGRYYTMDRDKRWERVRQGYDLLIHGKGKPYTDPLQAIRDSYEEGVTDEFIKPIVITDKDGKALGIVKEGDVFLCFNFRTDRLREITTVLSQKDMPEQGMKTIPLYYVTMAKYDDSFKGVHVIFEKDDVTNTLGELVSKAGLRQIRIAETEKYPHVTFFLSGGHEEPFDGERRILIPSPKVATYDLQPAMSAPELKDAIIHELEQESADLICLNFANGDMVGHTGVFPAIIKAVETVDRCVEEVTECALKHGYSVMITADHGNADYAINADGSPNTAHSLNLVPLFLLDSRYQSIRPGRLSDIAPTLLTIMGLNIPPEMTGSVLI